MRTERPRLVGALNGLVVRGLGRAPPAPVTWLGCSGLLCERASKPLVARPPRGPVLGSLISGSQGQALGLEE